MTELGVFIVICVAMIIVWRSDWAHEYMVANLPPLVHFGLEAECSGRFVKANDPGAVDQTWFHSRTLILGHDQQNVRGPAEASFVFPLQPNILRRGENVTAFLMIEAERIHGGLHSQFGPKQRKATIEINGGVIDEFWLIDRMPNGEDYGYRNVGPIPIDKALLNDTSLRVQLKIQEDVAWDIDRVVVRIDQWSRRFTVNGSMILGALIAGAIGVLPALLNEAIALIR